MPHRWAFCGGEKGLEEYKRKISVFFPAKKHVELRQIRPFHGQSFSKKVSFSPYLCPFFYFPKRLIFSHPRFHVGNEFVG
jgi:hypothetical protein